MNENNATVMYEKRFFKTIGKIVKKKVELVGNFVSVLQVVKCQIPLVVMMGSKDEAFDIERSLNAMLGAHQNFKSMPEIKLLKSYSKSPNISAGDCVTTSFIHFTNEESEFFNFVVELLNMPLFLENYRQYCSQNQKEARKLLFDVYSEIGQFYKEFEEYAESLEEGIRLPGVGFEIDRHLYLNSKRIIDADNPRFEGNGEEIEDEGEDDCEDGGEEDDDDDAGGSNGSGPGNSAGGNNAGGPSNSGGNNAGGNPNGKSGK